MFCIGFARNCVTVARALDVKPWISSLVSNLFCEVIYNTWLSSKSSIKTVAVALDVKPLIVSSTGFKISGNDNELFIDDKDGALRTYYFVGTTKTVVNANFGTVDYIAGKLSIPSANITSISDVDGVTSSQIRIVAVPSSPDIIPLRNKMKKYQQL